jgi:S-DNA-T family DNA segregation ATPase FtsK/SpoIIIE
MPALDDESICAAATIEHEMTEYLRLQPHERDNFSVLLYNCDSPDLPTAVVNTINRTNAKREDKITCQVLLMHRDEAHLRQIYRDLVARGINGEADPTEGSGDFLARVRVNITAANRLLRRIANHDLQHLHGSGYNYSGTALRMSVSEKSPPCSA